MPTASSNADVGLLLREWRERRRLTQLELALDAGTSARHLSFVETGRSKPGREVLLRVAEQLDVPFRERNQLLLAAGYAPAFPERSLVDPALAPVREALDRVLTAQEPYPAMAMDRGWNVVAANSAFRAFAEWVDPELLEPPVNALRMGLHPQGLAPLVLNLGEVRAYFLERLQQRRTMNMSKPGIGQLIAGAGGVLLIVSLFLPWADVEGVSQTGWEFSTMADVFFLIAGLVAIGAMITGGRNSFFRRDLSMNAATDLLGVVATLLLVWLIVFDFPAGSDPEIGAFLALIAAIAIMGGAGDYSVLRRRPRADRTRTSEVRQTPLGPDQTDTGLSTP